MSSQLISLAWDGHHNTLVRVFERLLVNSHFVDCTIAAEGRKMKAHKEVLSAFSSFFELLFSEETESNPTVIISGIRFRDLSSLVDFMYQGKLEVTEDRIQDLIDAAECLQIKGLGGGHEEDDSRNVSNTTVLPKRPAFLSGFPNKRARKAENEKAARVSETALTSDNHHKQTRKSESEEAASVISKESKGNNLIYSNEKQHEDSVVVPCGAKHTSGRNLMPNSDVQHVAVVSNTTLIPAQSTLSEVEMGRVHLQGEYVVKKELDSDGDENINEPMRDTSENTGEESILGLSADINVPSGKNVYEDLPLDCVLPTELGSQLCSRDLTGSFVKNELGNINVNVSSKSVDPAISAIDTQDPVSHSEFHMKSEDETFISVDDDLISENDEFSGNTPERIGISSFSEMQMKMVCMQQENNSSGAASECISESIYPAQDLSAAFGRTQRTGRNEPAVGLIPEVNPHNIPTNPSHTTSVCNRDLPGPSGRDGRTGSNSTNQQNRCQICGKTFIRNRHLSVHMRIHSEERLLQNECNNAAVTPISSNEHQHNESGRKLYKCTLCDFKSVHRSTFHVHMRIHKGLGPYKCTECEYTSAYSSNLKRHQRMHSGFKPYKCAGCEYTCAQYSDLKRHQRIHGMKP